MGTDLPRAGSGYAADGEDLEFRHYVRVVWRRKITLLLTVVVVTATALLMASRREAVYTASAEVLLQGRPSEQIVNLGSEQARTRVGGVETEVGIMRSESVREAAQVAFGGPVDVSISAQGDTDIVLVTATSEDPNQAARMAQVYAQTYVSVRREQVVNDLLAAVAIIEAEIAALDQLVAASDQPLRDLDAQILASFDPGRRSQLQSQRDQLVQQRQGPIARRETFQEQLDDLRLASNLTKTGGAQLLSRAVVPTKPSAPPTRRWVLMGLALGLVLGVVAAFGREHFDGRLTTRDDLERHSASLPLFAVIPRVPNWGSRKAVLVSALRRRGSSATEAYRRLRTALQFVLASEGVRVVQVTSPDVGEGKTTTAANLAVSLTQAGRRVVLVDCDLHRSRLHEFFGLDNAVGLSSVLLNETPLAAAIQQVPGQPRLSLLASGPLGVNASDLLASGEAHEMLATLAADADVVIVDGPPLLPVTDAVVLACNVDAVLVVVRSGRTSRSHLKEGLALLEQVEAPVIGSLLNGARAKRRHVLGGRGTFHNDHSGVRLRRSSPRRRPAPTSKSAARGDASHADKRRT